MLSSKYSEIAQTEPTPSPLSAYNLVDKTDESINCCNTVSQGAPISQANLFWYQESSEKE